MIRVTVVLDRYDCLLQLKADGHSGFGKKGEDIVCSAFTMLVRTAGRTLHRILEQRCVVVLSEQGTVELGLLSVPGGKREKVLAVTMFLMQGLGDLQEEYPACISLNIIINEGIVHES